MQGKKNQENERGKLSERETDILRKNEENKKSKYIFEIFFFFIS